MIILLFFQSFAHAARALVLTQSHSTASKVSFRSGDVDLLSTLNTTRRPSIFTAITSYEHLTLTTVMRQSSEEFVTGENAMTSVGAEVSTSSNSWILPYASAAPSVNDLRTSSLIETQSEVFQESPSLFVENSRLTLSSTQVDQSSYVRPQYKTAICYKLIRHTNGIQQLSLPHQVD